MLVIRQKKLLSNETIANTKYGLYNHSTFRCYSVTWFEVINGMGVIFHQKTMENLKNMVF